jgi:energy-coupling factor transport system permease protein
LKTFSLASCDPRCKLMLMACLSTLAMVWSEPLFLLYLLAFTCVLLLLGGVELSRVFRQFRGIIGLIISLFIIQSIFIRGGEPWLLISGQTLITTGGITFASILCLRLLILVFSALIMLTSEVRDYLLALVQMKIPYEIAFMIMASVHFLPILREEALNVFYAVQLRGCEIKKASVRQKIKTYLHICIPILACALYRSKAMAVAMEARAFRAYPQRTYLRRLQLKKSDKSIFGILMIITVMLIIFI